MANPAAIFVGLMSGTSLDGIDAVAVRLADAAPPELIATRQHPLPAELRDELERLTRPGPDELQRMGAADVRLGRELARAVNALLKDAGIAADTVQAIGSHGQTLRHYPGSDTPTSLQIGDPNIIAVETGIVTVADFRRSDMAAGGQGAPLVPAFHRAAFARPGEQRAILNIGGIANLTLLPADPTAPVTGFDTGPGNALLDAWIRRHRNQPCDEGGEWAASGRVHPELLAALLDDPYFTEAAPKSTGRDHFHLDWAAARWPGLERLPPADVMATFLELTAVTIRDALLATAPDTERLLVCGGGVHNRQLMKRLQALLPAVAVGSTAEAGLDPDWIEAIAFAWLARQRLLGLPGNVPGVTGATRPVVLGGVYRPGSDR